MPKPEPVATVSAFLTVGYSHEKAHGWKGTNRGYPLGRWT